MCGTCHHYRQTMTLSFIVNFIDEKLANDDQRDYQIAPIIVAGALAVVQAIILVIYLVRAYLQGRFLPKLRKKMHGNAILFTNRSTLIVADQRTVIRSRSRPAMKTRCRLLTARFPGETKSKVMKWRRKIKWTQCEWYLRLRRFLSFIYAMLISDYRSPFAATRACICPKIEKSLTFFWKTSR